jgi:hypothetical protein
MGAKGQDNISFVLRFRDRNGIITYFTGILNCKVPKSSNSRNSNRIPLGHVAFANCVKDSDSGTEQRRKLDRIDIIWYRNRSICMENTIFGN